MSLISRLLEWLFRHRLIPTPTPGPEPVPPQPPGPTPDISPGAVVAEINRVRNLSGRGSVWEDSLIGKVSQQWALAMAGNEALDHGDFFGRIASVYPNHAAGEDIAAGQTSALQVVSDWMSDVPHRETILGNYNHIGVGIARSARGTLYWVADFVLV